MDNTFLAMLELDRLDDHTFIGPRAPEEGARTYGGQFLAQTLRAAQHTVDDDRFVHSSHSSFLRAGDVAATTEMEVEIVRDGRSFSTRMVTACQNGREVFRTVLSFHVPETGLEYEPTIEHDVPGPDAEGHTSYTDFWNGSLPPGSPPWGGHDRPIDIRYVNAPRHGDTSSITEPQLMWMRVRHRTDVGMDDISAAHLHDVGLTYLADATLIDTVMYPHGKRWPDPRLSGASLDHTMWFHRRVDPHEWLLYDQRTEVTAGARGLASGRFYDRSGVLIATCVQEGLIRWTDG